MSDALSFLMTEERERTAFISLSQMSKAEQRTHAARVSLEKKVCAFLRPTIVRTQRRGVQKITS